MDLAPLLYVVRATKRPPLFDLRTAGGGFRGPYNLLGQSY
jgi:hypothetical protein